MHTDLTECGAEGLAAAMDGFGLVLLLALILLVYAWRSERAPLGCAALLVYAGLTRISWFNKPGLGLFPHEWYDCGAPDRFLILLAWPPLVALAVGVVFVALIGWSSARQKASGKIKKPSGGGRAF